MTWMAPVRSPCKIDVNPLESRLKMIQESQQTGTLEVLLTTATPAPVLIFLSAFSAFAGKLANLPRLSKPYQQAQLQTEIEKLLDIP